MDIGLALSVAQTLFAALQCSEFKEICSKFGYKSQLDDLQRTVSTVKAVLRDAATKLELSDEAQLWIEKLKDAVYDADDLLDKFVTLTEQKQKQLMEGRKASEKVRCFLSRYNPFGFAFNMSQEVKKIRKELDAIAITHTKFGLLSVDSQPIRKRREETCSYVYEGNIIGREDDVEKIVGILLDSNVQGDVSFLSIVGIGGLGKSALAQLLYNDARVTSAFPLRLWTCVSDHDQKQLNSEGILRTILASITGLQHEGSTKESVQNQVRENLSNNKYLLVLDDVWSENRNHWLNLVEFLLGGHRGSWIVVTTRSLETVKIMGDCTMHELQELSNENSWRLFKKVAFGSEQSSPRDDLVTIGREIIEACAGVPLALRVVGSLLYGQDQSKWLTVKEMGLANIRESKDDIMPILKLSYNNLDSSLQSCFSYCALFPKDYDIKKQKLISLWMAQGYVVPLDEHQSLEDAAEEYFSILLRRCFFQGVSKDRFGDIYSFKMHDLMHDIAQKVSGKEICTSSFITNNLDKKVRHLALMRSESETFSFTFTKNRIRSYLQTDVTQEFSQRPMMHQRYLDDLVVKFTCLRVLDLSHSDIKSLPSRIGELLHLRYLDLSNNKLQVLPKSIKKLYNLETLDLSSCELKELPKDINKLVKLRVLDVRWCYSLNSMPSGLGKLTNLRRLPLFKLCEPSSRCKQWFDQLEDLKVLKNLRGNLNIIIKLPKDAKIDGKRERECLKNKEHLNSIRFGFIEMAGDIAEALMEEMQPHCNLKGLEMYGYHGVRMPSWAKSLQNLVSIEITTCNELQHLTDLGNFHNLKVLKLGDLPNLEYITENYCSAPKPPTGSSKAAISSPAGPPDAEGLSFLPTLEELTFLTLPKLKIWGRSGVGDNHHQIIGGSSMDMAPVQLLCLSQLKSLCIEDCPELISIPLCPGLRILSVEGFNKMLQIMKEEQMETSSTTSEPTPKATLRQVQTDNVTWLNSLPMEYCQQITSMGIHWDTKVESLEEVEQMLRRCSSSLRELSISDCDKLRSVSRGLEHLTALERLSLGQNCNLKLSEEERKDESDIGMPWRSLRHSLRFLELDGLQELMALPNWIQYLAALQKLRISYCFELKSLPAWMSKVTSLRSLEIFACSGQLRERCQNPTGEDWPYIQHIPKIVFG